MLSLEEGVNSAGASDTGKDKIGTSMRSIYRYRKASKIKIQRQNMCFRSILIFNLETAIPIKFIYIIKKAIYKQRTEKSIGTKLKQHWKKIHVTKI